MENNYWQTVPPLASHQYAIIDRLHYPDIPKNWPVFEMASPLLAPQAHFYPWLLPLHELPADEWQAFMATLAQAEGASTPPLCCLLLQSPHPIRALRSRLVESLHFTDEKRQRFILRYYDPHVLFHFYWMLTPWLLAKTLPYTVVTCWTFWLEGHWHSLSLPHLAPRGAGEGRQVPSARLADIGLINRVLAKLPPITDMVERQQCSQQIEAALMQARQLKFTAEEDILAFAQHSVLYRHDFWQLKTFQVLIKNTVSKPRTYARTTQSWSPTQWQQALGLATDDKGEI